MSPNLSTDKKVGYSPNVASNNQHQQRYAPDNDARMPRRLQPEHRRLLRQLGNIDLPEDCNIAAILRGPELIIPSETTELKEGDDVRQGQKIATVGDTGALTGPRLYFEVRYQGKPQDPEQWLRQQRG